MKKIRADRIKRKSMHRTAAAVMAAAMVLTGITVPSRKTEAAQAEYEIYPSPHVVEYTDGSYILSDINIVYESGIDQAARDRLSETLDLKSDLTVSESETMAEGKTNILVGIEGSGGCADTYADEHIEVSTGGLYEKLDSYVLDSHDNVITVVGADADASFYGLTTLYHIIRQMDSYTIRNFHMEDWADVASRGFIEGYYGNPWSTQDRINLMKWGGYYKLNSYFYAPKNDPKHNAKWRELYTEDEIETLIRPLADAGNASKCRFVYALHPFMNSPIRFDGNYEADLAAVQAKFEQVIKAGVRQIAILADDAASVGGSNYVRFLNDMTAWLAEMGTQYTDLKQTLPFCTVEYMGNGESYYNQFPENVQIVMTGGKVWGEVNDSFTSAFTERAGRGPYMWINWPCTDNSKKHLIMGGYSTFLHPGVDPDKIQGIVLNPMQQSEPSKVAIFGNACYSWNIWNEKAQADRAWEDSFKYVDHNSAVETEASAALRELSRHMINQNMDSRVTVLQESENLAPALTEFRQNLGAGTVTGEQADALIGEFEKLQKAADTYEAQAGDTNVRDQIIYWLDCWDDTADAAIAYLNGVRAVLDSDPAGLLQYSTEGKAAFERSKTHKFWYLDHYEYAEVGVQHIVPFIQALDSWLSAKVKETADPAAVTQTYISNAFTNPSSGSTDNVLDGNDSTSVQFKEPNYPKAGDYFGIRFNRPVTVDSLRVLMGGGKNHLQYSKFQYLPDGADEEEGWKDVSGTEYTRGNGSGESIEENGLALENVKAVRLIATQNNSFDSWVAIHSFDVNRAQTEEPMSCEIRVENAVPVTHTDPAALTDGDHTSEFWLKSPDGDWIDENAAVVLDFGEIKEIGSVYVAQDAARANGGDIIGNGIVEYSTDGTEWKTFGDLKQENEQTVSGSASARYIRVRNEEQKNVWWRISEITVSLPDKEAFAMTASALGTQIGKNPAVNDSAKNNKYEYIVDGNSDTFAWMAGEGNTNILSDQGVQISFNREAAMKEISILQGSGDKVSALKVEYQSGDEWKELTTVQSAGSEVKIQADGTRASAIRLTNAAGDTGVWWKLYEVNVTETASADTESVYTDVEGTDFTAAVEEESAVLTPGEITLGAGQYIGIDMKEIRKLTSIDAEYTGEGVELQYSDNGKVWTKAEKDAAGKTARYVRLVNLSDSEAKVKVSRLAVSLYTVGKMGELVSSDIPVNASWGDTRSNGKAFDGDMTTQTKFGGSAAAGNTAVFSLGQELNIRSLRIYTSDNTQDYIRDAKVQLSTDGKEWKDVFEIGDGKADTADQANQNMSAAGAGEADSNYPNIRYYGKDDLDEQAGYIRLYVTADFPDRSMIINEIVINGGAYVSPEGNMAFSGTLEEKGHQPGNMLDGDFSTTYRPSQADGSMTYRISDGGKIRSFRIIQSGEASRAAVKVQLYNEKTGSTETRKAGTLAQAVNEFTVEDGYTLLAVTFEWGDRLPDIAEILLLEQEAQAADKEKLNALLGAEPDAYDTWTTSSQKAYDTVKETAKAVADSEGISQATVDSAVESLRKAEANAQVRADQETIRALQEMIGNKEDNSRNIYTSVSYMTYSNAIERVRKAMEDPADLSGTAAEALAGEVETAKTGLVYSTRNRELAELEIRRYSAVSAENYTVQSYAELTEAKDAAAALVEKDKAAENGDGERVNPLEFIDARTAFCSAADELVDVTALKEVLAQAETVDASLYTEESYQAYEKAAEEGKKLLDNGTADQVAAAVENIRAEYGKLKYKDSTSLEEAIAEAEKLEAQNYTSDSYEALAALLAEARENMEDDSYTEKIRTAVADLVDVTALKAQIKAAEEADKNLFTASSVRKLEELLGQTGELLKSGSREAVASMAADLEQAVRSLVPRADGVEDYRESIVLKPEKDYTSDSYRAYRDAYEALVNADPADLSPEAFARLKAEFEQAELELKNADDKNREEGSRNDTDRNKNSQKNGTDTAVQTGDNTDILPVVIVLILCAAAAAAVIIIRQKRR